MIPRSTPLWSFTALTLFAQVSAAAQGSTSAPAPAVPADQADARSTGLPSNVAWTFTLDAGWGSFGFANSYFNNPKVPGVAETLSDQWLEGYVKPALSGLFTLKSASQIYGRLSAVGERTYGEAPALYGPDVSSFGVDDLSIGWRSGVKGRSDEDHLLDVSVGRLPYQLGHGMLIWDGASEGGSRGGYWTNARKAFQFAVVGSVRPGPHRVDVFYLDKDELPEGDTGTRLTGFNYQFTHGETMTLGATYVRGIATPDVLPARDGLNLVNLRADTAPVPKLPDLSIAVEYASEQNGNAIDSHAWSLQSAYELSAVKWQPTLSYRYAFFQGDDPGTARNEAFDPLLPGFSDWGTWWQGEIAGEYFLSNSNLASQMVRAHLQPTEKVGMGVIVYDFRLDEPASYGPGVTDRHAAVEADGYVDWTLNDNFTISVVGAYAHPGKAVEQLTGRTKPFSYGMVYVAYHF